MKSLLLKYVSIFLVAAGMILGSGSVNANEIRVLNWKGYGTDEPWAIAEFEKRTGYNVKHDYFTSEEEMFTKLRTNPGAHDVVMVNSAFTAQARDEGLIKIIDTAGIENIRDLEPGMLVNEQLVSTDGTYGVPWVWGLTSFAYNTEVIKTAPNSLEVFWDPKYKGKIGWRDDAVEAVQLAALVTGQNINAITDLPAIKTKLTALMPQIRTFWSSENDWNQFMAAGEFTIATYWSGSASRSASQGLPVAFVVPEEGAIAWLDALSVTAKSKNTAAAIAFIDYMIDPRFYARWAKSGAPVSANTKAFEALPESSFNRRVLGDLKVLSSIQIVQPVSAKDRKAYLTLWQELKANAK